jgi:hypothetical protein
MFGVGRYFAKVPKPEVAYFVGSESVRDEGNVAAEIA